MVIYDRETYVEKHVGGVTDSNLPLTVGLDEAFHDALYEQNGGLKLGYFKTLKQEVYDIKKDKHDRKRALIEAQDDAQDDGLMAAANFVRNTYRSDSDSAREE
jgi:hypothetical protein